MNAVIIYNDAARAAKAKAMLERATHRADVSLLWTVKPWRLDLLTLPLTSDEALADAADAHLMVLALRHPLLMPAALQDWLTEWATRRQVQSAALATWDGGNGDSHWANAAPDLSKFAERHGLSFISGNGRSAAHKATLFTRPLPDRRQFANLLPQPMRRPGRRNAGRTMRQAVRAHFALC